MAAENAQLVGVSDVIVERARATGERFGAKAYRDTEDLLSDPTIDAVYISAPPGFHAELTTKAARHGKHVLCEKPIALNAYQAEEMVRVCSEQNVRLGVGYMMRYHGAHQKMRDLIQTGAIGRPVAARIRYSVWSPPVVPDQEFGGWQHDPEIAGGGPLMDMGVHTIDLISMLLGPITDVASVCSTLVHDYEVEDTCTALFRFQSGAQGVMECYMSVPNHHGRRLVEVYGSEGMLVAQNTIFQLPTGDLWHYRRTSDGFADAEPEEVEYTPANMYETEIRLFSEAVESHSPYQISGEEGLCVQRVVDAIYRSSAERRVIILGSEASA
jgi:predicted dehydrogenase